MAVDPTRIWAALRRQGMLKDAVVTIAGIEQPGPTWVGFVESDELVFNGILQATSYAVEYLSSDLPGLRVGDTMAIAGAAYRVSQRPARKADGTFSVAALELQK